MRKRIFSTVDPFKACDKENELLTKGYQPIDRSIYNLSKLEYVKFEHIRHKFVL